MDRAISNNVRGPSSALTEFLRESGITPTTVARRAATRQRNSQQTQDPASQEPDNDDGTSHTGRDDEVSRENTRMSSRSRDRHASDQQVPAGYASDNLDEGEDGEEDYPAPAKKRRRTKLSVEKVKAKAKKKKDDDDFKSEDDTYTALSGSLRGQNSSRPPVGSFATCGICEKQFTVTKYTPFGSSGSLSLCHHCAKSEGIDPFKKHTAQRKRKAPIDKRTVQSFEERRFPTLVSLCIQLIAKHIDDVEALGDIGAMNMEVIAKALAKNRSLTPENAHLFYSVENTNLVLYDCTKLTAPALQTLSMLNPALVSLRLDFCGYLDTETFITMSISMPHLKRLELLGPFLVHSEAWIKFFKTHPHLEGFLVTQCPKFDLDCVKNLIKECQNIKELRLKEMKVNDDWLQEIAASTSLKVLDLSSPATTCSENAFSEMLCVIGPKLEGLDLSGHEITDTFLEDGLEKFTGSLERLSLAGCPGITDKAISRLFNSWSGGEDAAGTNSADGCQDAVINDSSLNTDGPVRAWNRMARNSRPAIHRPRKGLTIREMADIPPCHNVPLVAVELGRNHLLGSRSLISIMQHSGARLESLNMNGWKDVTAESLEELGKYAQELKKLDVGWCRNVDDFVLAGWVGINIPVEGSEKTANGSCLKLAEIKVWGCNRVMGKFQRRRGVIIHGIESQTSA
ncbi:hypothetical protein AX15_000216 [Amanita polypyramis BW_CC]|nr:hypothetical protein AX15_000216 [Amanita polypyramis BW_CC]